MIVDLSFLDVHEGMSFHVNRVLIRIKMGVFQGVLSSAMAQYKLGDRCSCNFVEVGSGSMSEQMGVEMFIDTDLNGDTAKNIL